MHSLETKFFDGKESSLTKYFRIRIKLTVFTKFFTFPLMYHGCMLFVSLFVIYSFMTLFPDLSYPFNA